MTQIEIIDQMARVQFMSGVALGISIATGIFALFWISFKSGKEENE